MSSRSVNFVISITLLAIIVDTTALKCAEENPCSCHLLDGSFYDLNEFAKGPPMIVTKYNYSISFQLCKNVRMDMGYTNSSDCNSAKGVSLCARFGNHMPFSLGTTMDTKWNILKNHAELEISHEPNTTLVTLVCCEKCESSVLNLDTEPVSNKFHLTLTTQHACSLHGPPEGISTGSLLVILLFVFSGVYLLVGALALKFFRGAIGWELIPNYDFWSDLPALVRDGVAFTFSGCSTDTYDRI